MRMRAALLLLLALPSAGEARWRKASSEHFIIYSEQGPDELKRLATKLERYDTGMRLIGGLPPGEGGSANRLTIYVLSNDQDVHKIATGKEVRPLDFMISGLYLPRAGDSIAIVSAEPGGDLAPQSQATIFHEYAHHIMFENGLAAYPAWYVEGFAEFNGSARIKSDGSGGFGYPATIRLRGLLAAKPLKLNQMLGELPEKMTPEQREAIYGRGWLLTHYLTFSKERGGQLAAYLKALNSGKTSLEAARMAFGDLDVLDRELDHYLHQSQILYLPIPASALQIRGVDISELSDGEDAIIPVRVRSKRGVDAKTARDVLAEARKVGAGYPNDPAVQLALAEAAFDMAESGGKDADYLAEADIAADRVLAADPNNVRAMVYKSRVALLRAGKSGTPDRAAAAQDWAIKANHLDPEDPVPLVCFYNSFMPAGKPPSASAQAGLARAFELAPQDVSLRWMMVNQAIGTGNLAEARLLLKPIAYSPHGGKVGEQAAEMIRKIDANDAAGLRQLLQKPPEAASAGS